MAILAFFGLFLGHLGLFLNRSTFGGHGFGTFLPFSDYSLRICASCRLFFDTFAFSGLLVGHVGLLWNFLGDIFAWFETYPPWGGIVSEDFCLFWTLFCTVVPFLDNFVTIIPF